VVLPEWPPPGGGTECRFLGAVHGDPLGRAVENKAKLLRCFLPVCNIAEINEGYSWHCVKSLSVIGGLRSYESRNQRNLEAHLCAKLFTARCMARIAIIALIAMKQNPQLK
jgi:hypothetical protein